MKHTCVNHKTAEILCINPFCTLKCSYICSDGTDTCKHDHEGCATASIGYLLKKCHKIEKKAQDIMVDRLEPILELVHRVMTDIQNLKYAKKQLSEIHKFLDPHGLLEPKQKKKILDLMSSPLIQQSQSSFTKLDGNLQAINAQIVNYLSHKRSQKKRVIQQRVEIQSKIKERSSIKKSKVKDKDGFPSPVKSSFVENSSPGIKSKIKSKDIGESGLMIEKVLSSTLKGHVPKPPFFSKITNDNSTIYSLFYHKFSQVKLLYRATEQDFSVNKFHQRCDGVKNTLTFVLTEFDKIIGGFTPLAWKKGGGEWYEDPSETSFIFNLSAGERYPLQNKEKAIWCSHAYGPSFGLPDLQIADKALYNSNSCANFPQCYNNGNYVASTGSTQLFCGTKTGHFKIKEWEVYELSF